MSRIHKNNNEKYVTSIMRDIVYTRPSIESLDHEKFDRITANIMLKDMQKFILKQNCNLCHISLRIIYFVRKYINFIITYRPYLNEYMKLKHDVNMIYNSINTQSIPKCTCHFYKSFDPVFKMTGETFIKQELFRSIELINNKCHKYCLCYKCNM